MTYDFIETEIRYRKGIITLNRPDKRNAMNKQVVEELTLAFAMMEDDQEVKVVILRSEGEVFSAGADLAYLRQLQEHTYEENLEDSKYLKDLFLKIYKLNKPVIAAVQGHAIAGGCGLISVCDFVIASSKAKFGYTEVRIGFIPALVMVFLVRKIGEAKARELLLGGKLIKARKAQKYGIVNRVCKTERLEVEVQSLADDLILNNSAASMSLVKEMMGRVQDMPLHEALDYASEMNAKARSTEDCKKGLNSFLNKISIEW
jgi:methylglutaconyl-CoA hydratase